MRPLRALVIYIAVVFIGGALLAPWLYWLAQPFAQAIPRMANSPFHVFVSRSILGLALIGVWPLLRSVGMKSLGEAGLVSPGGHWHQIGSGFAAGFCCVAVVASFALVSGARELIPGQTAARLAEAVVRLALTAGVVAVVEEILFRGAVFGSLRKVFNWVFALVLSSVMFALVHFLEPVKAGGTVAWYSGLQLLPYMMRGFVDLHALLPAFFNLTLAGLLLGLAYQRTGNLYFSIGLHAGWIFWVTLYGTCTREFPGALTWWWGGESVIDGWFALPVLAATLAILARLPARRI